MASLTNTGILQGSGNNSYGGLKSVWITELSNIDYDSLDIDSDGVITGMTSAFVTGITMYKYNSNDQAAYHNQTATIDDTAGTTVIIQELLMKFAKQDADKRNEMKYFATVRTVAIIEDWQGEYYLVGAQKGLRPSVLNTTSGAAGEDPNGYDITLTGKEPDFAPLIISKSTFSSYIDVA